MSPYLVMTHSAPRGAYAGWSYCAIDDCECSLPKVCTQRDNHCTRPKVCTKRNCDCGRPRACTDPNCDCSRPKVITDRYGRPLRP